MHSLNIDDKLLYSNVLANRTTIKQVFHTLFIVSFCVLVIACFKEWVNSVSSAAQLTLENDQLTVTSSEGTRTLKQVLD